MTDELLKVVDRIHKLLALANDGGATPAEAELAMAKAQEMMAEHNLTMATLEAKGGKKEARVKQEQSENLMYAWKRELLEVIAKVNLCYVYVTNKRTNSGQRIGGGYEIIGRQSNVIATKNIFSYLLQSIERFVVAEVGTNMHDRYTRSMHSFRVGCADKLKERLIERHEKKLEEQAREAREAEARNRHPGAATGTALVVVLKDFAQNEVDLNNDMANGWEPGTTATRRTKFEAEKAARTEKMKRRYVEAKALGLTEDQAYYYAAGYDLERSKVLGTPEPAKPQRPETERQRQKREEREYRQRERYYDQQQRREAKTDWRAYDRGQIKGAEVGLDEQIGSKGNGNKIGN